MTKTSSRKLRAVLEEILPAVEYAELQARFTFDPLIRGLHEETRGTPSGLTVRLQEAVTKIREALE